MSGVETTAPELDVVRVQRWCRTRVPEHARHQVRIECEVSGRDLTVVERHPPWPPEAGPEWMRTPVARLRYVRSRRVWRLYWIDSDDRWHEYPELPFAPDVADLLAELEEDPTALFWG
jgi:Protein of unknown function (DUF3024)